MPLIKGKSKRAFGKNVEIEMENGKPQKQALAIAYSMKRKARKKMAMGGAAKDPVEDDRLQDENPEHNMLAEGGQIKDNYQSMSSEHGQTRDGSVDDMAEYDSEDYNKSRPMKPNHSAMSEDERKLNQHGQEEQGPDGMNMAEGGQIMDNLQDAEHMLDMVGKIMKQRQQHFSEGGKVANDVRMTAGSQPNEFDDLALRDDLEMHDDAKNSGDELDNEGENKRRKDVVAQIMASRKKKDRLPNPR